MVCPFTYKLQIEPLGERLCSTSGTSGMVEHNPKQCLFATHGQVLKSQQAHEKFSEVSPGATETPGRAASVGGANRIEGLVLAATGSTCFPACFSYRNTNGLISAALALLSSHCAMLPELFCVISSAVLAVSEQNNYALGGA